MNKRPGAPNVDPPDVRHEALITTALESVEVQRRLEAMEKRIERLDENLLDRHTKQITWIFSVVAVLVAVLSIWSKIDTSTATRDMQDRLDKSITEMHRQFEVLSGEAMKKPSIQILATNGALDGRVFEASAATVLDLGPIFLKNTGSKGSDTLSIRLFSSENLNLLGNWDRVASNDRDYANSWYLVARGFTIDKGETSTVESGLRFQLNGAATNINFKLQVFYGGENPAEAEFQVRIKP